MFKLEHFYKEADCSFFGKTVIKIFYFGMYFSISLWAQM